jgi:hypothetical protein
MSPIQLDLYHLNFLSKYCNRWRYNSKLRHQHKQPCIYWTVTINILLERRDFPNRPAYDILHKMLSKLQGIEEEQKETMEFLDTAIEGKKIFKEENEKLRERVKSLEENVKGLQSIIGNNSSNNTAVAAIFDRSIYI